MNTVVGANCLRSFDNSWEIPIVTIPNNNRFRSHVPESIDRIDSLFN